MIKRSLSVQLEKFLNHRKSILLLGPRQVGKTTLLKTLSNAHYFSLAKPSIRLQYEKDPSRLEREVEALRRDQHQSSQPLLIVIDEIQKVPGLMDSIQDLIDEKVAQFILTGSSARKLKKSGQINLLPGRVISLRMDPLSLNEFSDRSLEEHLLDGDLPAIVLENDKEIRSHLLQSYVESYLEEEVKSEALVRGIGPFARFLELAAIEAGRIANFSNLSKEVGPSVHTIMNYYEVLVDCLIAERIEPLTESLTRKKLTKSPKFLFFDMGVRRIAAHEGTHLIPERMGELFEQWIGLELIRMIRNLSHPGALHFWRDADGPEVDWVLKTDEKLIPIEVKWTDSPTKREGRHLETFLNEYPKATQGFIVCRTPRTQQISEKIKSIPWQELEQVLR